MRVVLISIRPKWCEKIINGDKTIEVRKTRPKIDTPFKCYIYCTLQGCNDFFRVDLGGDVTKWNRGKWADRKGKVIGEFICDRIYELAPLNHAPDDVEKQACLTREEIADYLKGTGYGWHISDLEIYDQPKELNEFWFPPELYCEKERCGSCPCDQAADVNGEYSFDCEWKRPLTRAPQSWCYVEDVHDEHC